MASAANPGNQDINGNDSFHAGTNANGPYAIITKEASLAATPINTTTSVKLSKSSAKYGDRIDLTATVKEIVSGKPVNGGTVKFSAANKTIGSVSVVNGRASFKWVADLNVGQYNITTTYKGIVNYQNSETKNTFNQIQYNGTNWTVHNYLTNTQIQYIINNCKSNSNIIFAGGQYKKLSLTIFKPVNIKGNGVVTLMGNSSNIKDTGVINIGGDSSTSAFFLFSNCSIRGLIIRNYSSGIILNMANNVIIANNTFLGNMDGVINYGSGSGVKISTTNVFKSNKGSAIHNYGNKLTFKGFKLVNNNVGITNNGANVDIVYNTISGGEYGVINYASSADVNYNKIFSTSKSGIYNTGSKSRIKSNTLQKNNYGVYNLGSNSTIISNTITGGNTGISNNASATNLSKNTIKSVKNYGILNTAGSKNKIYNNNLTGLNKGYGIYLDKKTKSNLIQGNKVNKFSSGVLEAGSSNTLKSNTLTSNDVGLTVSSSARNTQVISNKINGGNGGIINNANSITISKNTIKSVKSYGIYNSGSKNKISNNNLTGVGIGYGIYSYKNAKSNSVQGNTVSNFAYGLFETGSSNTIKSNTFKSNKIGLNISNSARNTQITSNKISKSTSYGVYNEGRNSTLYKNALTSNRYALVTIKSVKNTKNTMKGNKVNIVFIK